MEELKKNRGLAPGDSCSNSQELSEELLEEIYEIYAYDVDAIILHMSKIIEKGRKKISFKKNKLSMSAIRSKLENKDNIGDFKGVFSEIISSSKEDIQKYTKLSNLIMKSEVGAYYILSEIVKDSDSIILELNNLEKAKLANEFGEIALYCQEIESEIRIKYLEQKQKDLNKTEGGHNYGK